jgi:hypothetical protein
VGTSFNATRQLFAKFDGAWSDGRYTGHLWTGIQGTAIQWIIVDDPIVESQWDSGDILEVYPVPAFLRDDDRYGDVATYGAKYIGRMDRRAML